MGEEAEVGERRWRELQVHGEPSGGGFPWVLRIRLRSEASDGGEDDQSASPYSFLTYRTHFTEAHLKVI